MKLGGQKIELFERIKKASHWVSFPKELRQDLIQETWLLCLDYANKRNKGLNDLSNTEIKHRLFESIRKIKTKDSLLVSPDEIPESGDFFADKISAEKTLAATEQVTDIEWILSNHPKIKLTSRQKLICDEMKNITSRTQNLWKAHFARKLGVTRQDIYSIERVVKRKLEVANDLSKFLQGEISPFLNKYSSSWPVSPVLRNALIFPLRSTKPTPLSSRIKLLHGKIKSELLTLLNNGEKDGVRLDYLTDLAALTNPRLFPAASLDDLQSTYAKNHFMDIFTANSLNYRLLAGDEDPLYNYSEKLKYFIARPNSESKRLAGYTLCAYGCTDQNNTQKFLQSEGSIFPSKVHLGPIIKRTYKNMAEKFYAGSKAAVDYNFLRMLFVIKASPNISLSSQSKNSLKTIAQKSRWSKDRFVAKEAENIISLVS